MLSVNQLHAQKPNQYTREWTAVDSLNAIGQPRSALEVVSQIYQMSLTEKNGPQFIKAILYRIKLISDFQENSLRQSILDLQGDLRVSEEPATSLLHSILGELYWQYYSNNRYLFEGRSYSPDHLSDSLATWDLKTIIQAITNEYLLSLQNHSLLRTIPVESYKAILEVPGREERPDEALRRQPTLFDFLVHRSLNYFTTTEGAPVQGIQYFLIDQPVFFGASKIFTGYSPSSPFPDPLDIKKTVFEREISNTWIAFRLYQALESFHQDDEDPTALIGVVLERLEYMRRIAFMAQRDSLYSRSLADLEKEFLSHPEGTAISFARASFLSEEGSKYQPLWSDLHRYEKKAALSVCEDANARFPESVGAKNCRTLAKTIQEKSLRITTESAVPVGKPFPALLEFRNIRKVGFRLITIDPDRYAEKISGMNQEALHRFLATLPVQKSWSIDVPETDDFQNHSMEIPLPGMPGGFYILWASDDTSFVEKDAVSFSNLIWVTDISYITQRQPDGTVGVFLLDRSTGLPLTGATAEIMVRKYESRSRSYSVEKIGQILPDKNGYLTLSNPAQSDRYVNLYLKISNKQDQYNTQPIYVYPVTDQPERTVTETRFFTDRSIYRPGQTVWFKGILMEKTGDRRIPAVNRTTEVVFSDVNGQKITSRVFTSNEFGSFNGSFIAPTGVLNGEMVISNGSGSVSFSVEEYKRPTFYVDFSPVEGQFKTGEQITLQGSATGYAGYPVTGATVAYRVVRQARFPYWDRWYIPFPSSPETEIVNGTTQTDSDGNFTLKFPAIPDYQAEASSKPVFDFRIIVNVTDPGGETHPAEQVLSVGPSPILIDLQVPQKFDISSDSAVKVCVTNLAGAPVGTKVSYLLEKITPPDRVFKPRYWQRPDLNYLSRREFYGKFPYDVYAGDDDPMTRTRTTIFTSSVHTGTDSLIRLSGLVPGSYLLTVSAVDTFGQPIEKKMVFDAFLPMSKEMPVVTLDWYVPVVVNTLPGQEAFLLTGSSEDNILLIREIWAKEKLISRTQIKTGDRVTPVRVMTEPGFRGNFSINLLFVKHNRVFQHSQLIQVPWEDKNLDIRFSTFRDKMDPGQKEEWILKITDASGKPADAELLASMYDASLDVFRPHQWSFDLYQRFFPTVSWDVNDAFTLASGTSWTRPHPTEGYLFPSEYRLNWFGMYFHGGYGYRNRYGNLKDSPVMMQAEGSAVPSEDASGAGSVPGSETPAVTPPRIPAAEPEQPFGVRRNFTETAFFYPSLITDSTGSILLKFTAPESLTKWKLQGLALTRDLKYGLITRELVTRKDLMVFPNTPRFVRQGDTLVFTTRIVNLTGQTLNCEATILVTDPLSGTSLESIVETPARQNLTVGPQGNSVVSWQLAIPADADFSLLQYRITASSGNFSDGEEKIIPVLTNRIMVTESMPMPVYGAGTTDFSFEKLLKSRDNGGADHYRLTLEFASNPAWFAIQALPELNDVTFKHADAVFAAWYSNSIAAHILHSDPEIRTVFESWRSLTPDALLSNLEKNEDLKSALLEETPWVLDARNETDRKRRLGMYFDENTLEMNLRKNLDLLRKLQRPNGGWSWFEGMPESRWITQQILTGLGHLDHLGISSVQEDPETREMVRKAIVFLDRELDHDLMLIRKTSPGNLTDAYLSPLQIQYLYARTYFMDNPNLDRPLGKQIVEEVPESFQFFKEQAMRFWLKQDLYQQAMIALALHRTGEENTPKLILKSLAEKALHSPELGMYWSLKQGWTWYQAPVETQAMMIEAFDEVNNDRRAVEEMKIWLLKQKQTRQWRSPRATVEAVYALLLRGTELLNTLDQVTLKAGDRSIDPSLMKEPASEAGTGYFTMSWQGKEISPDMGKVTIVKKSDGVAWGALYWQYFENLDRITPAATPLKLRKELFVERNSPSGPVLDKILPASNKSHSADPAWQQTLKAGDVVKVRIVVTSDRDMEFVHLKDMRAAGFEVPVAPNNPRLYKQSGWSSVAGSLSGYRFQDGLGYYQSFTDQAVHFFFDYLPKGVHVVEYTLLVNSPGDFSNGITTIQCLYAPEFSAHSEGFRIIAE